MNLEVHNAEVVQRVATHVQTGNFHDVDDVLEKALDALDQQIGTTRLTGETGAVIVKALQSSPYREIDLTPPPVLLTNVRDTRSPSLR